MMEQNKLSDHLKIDLLSENMHTKLYII